MPSKHMPNTPPLPGMRHARDTGYSSHPVKEMLSALYAPSSVLCVHGGKEGDPNKFPPRAMS